MELSQSHPRRLFLVAAATLLVSVSPAVLAYVFREMPQEREFRIIKQQTLELPAIDRVEILRVEEPTKRPSGSDFIVQPYIDFAGYAPILQSKTVTGHDAQQLAKLWRSRTFGGSGALCHEPPYALRFFRGNRLVFETSVCWECFNCFVATGRGGYRWLGFADENEELLNELKRLVPLPPPQQPTSPT